MSLLLDLASGKMRLPAVTRGPNDLTEREVFERLRELSQRPPSVLQIYRLGDVLRRKKSCGVISAGAAATQSSTERTQASEAN